MKLIYGLTVEKSDVSYDFSFFKSKKISVGRKDISIAPDIDLGPYDDGPYVSRIQGYFFIEDGGLYYEDKGKNKAYINESPIKDKKIRLNNKDKLRFGSVCCEVVVR